MIVVIVCADKKDPRAPYMLTKKGRRVMFVADPKNAQPRETSIIYRHPDDDARAGQSWREKLLKYNRKCQSDPSGNTFELLAAWQLYAHPIYSKLVCKFGNENVFILSAGWGLISSDFFTPNYNITFSQNAAKKKPWALEQKHDYSKYPVMLPEGTSKPVVFLGGKEYIPFFCSLTKNIKSERIVFYNSAKEPPAPGCTLSLFETTTLTNWYYECGKCLCEAKEELAEDGKS